MALGIFWTKRQGRQSLAALACGAGFLILAEMFHVTDPFATLFFSHRFLPHFLHNFGRLLFFVYLFEIFFAMGQLPLSLMRRKGIDFELDAGEEIAISILCGSAILRVMMLMLGFANLYEWWLLVGIAALASMYGWNRFWTLCAQIIRDAKAVVSCQSLEGVAILGLMFALAAACGVVFVEKFLFPNGTGDYFSHYFPYYKYVVTAKNIWPNDLWYHFYVSKGVGDVFFSIILSDLLGPAAVSCVMFFVGLIVMFSIMRRITNDLLIALAATAMTAVGFIWTYEQTIGFTHWAEFPKQHVITAVLFFGGVFASWRQRYLPQQHWLAWAFLTSLIFVGLIILRTQFSLLCLIFLGIMTIWAMVSGQRQVMLAHMIVGLSVLATLIVMLTINYQITGLAEVTPFRFFWRFADQAKFAEWVSPFMMLLLDLGSSPDLGSISPPNLHQFPVVALFIAVFRLDRALPLLFPWGLPLLLATCVMIVCMVRNNIARQKIFSYAAVFVIMLVAAVMVFFSVNQIGSLYRLYMFCLFPVIALSLLPFAVARRVFGQTVSGLIGLVVAGLMVIGLVHQVQNIPAEQRHLQWHFAMGKLSISEAFDSQKAVWKEALGMSAVVGTNAIWSTQVGWYFCIAPQCSLQTFFSYSMGKDWANIMFQPPEAARTKLQKLGINYFAFDTNTVAFDLLPYSPLFAPEHIAEWLGLVWSENGVYLLTWRSNKTQPLPAAFLTGYRKSIKEALKNADFPVLYQRLAAVYEKWKMDEKWPVKNDKDLPRVRGWQ